MKPKITESELGQIKIGQAVYATIAAIAARRTHGIAGMESTFNDGLSRFFGAKHDYEGVKVYYTDSGELHMTVYIAVSYGYRIPDLVLRLQEKIRTAVQEFTGIKVEAIDVVVQKLIFDNKPLVDMEEKFPNSSLAKEEEADQSLDIPIQEDPLGLDDLEETSDPKIQSILARAKEVALHTEGIHALSPRRRDEVEDKLTAPLGRVNLPGINLRKRKDGLEINLYLMALYGYNLISVAHKLQESIRQVMYEQYKLDNVKVDVHFERLLQETNRQQGEENDKEN